MVDGRRLRRLAGACFLACGALQCATAPSPNTPARPAEVAELAEAGAPISPPGPEAAPSPTGPRAQTRPVPAAASPGADSDCSARVGAKAVRRSALSRTLDAGLGRWLQGVDVEPKLTRGRFQGWLVRRIYSGDPCWRDIDLRAGDVVSRINRLPIERPEEAQAVWTALRSAREIVVDLFRAGEPRTLRFAIVDEPG